MTKTTSALCLSALIMPAPLSTTAQTTPTADSPVHSALAAAVSTAAGAIIPVTPFFFLTGTSAVITAAVVSIAAHFVVGAAKSLVTLRTWWASGLEMTVAGVIVGAATYLVGLVIKFAGG